MELTRRQMMARISAGMARVSAGMAAMAAVGAGDAMAAQAPAEPIAGAGKIAPRMRLSMAAYSLRDYLPRDGKPGKMTLFDWMDLAAAWGCDAVEPTAYYFTSEERDYMNQIKAKAFKLGLDVSGTAIGNNFCAPKGEERDKQVEYTKRWIDHAADFGAPAIRVFGGHKPKGGGDREQDLAGVIECLKPCCDYAATRGVFLAIENHGYLTETTADLFRILDGVNHEWLGITLDTGNFVSEPYKNIALAAPKALTVQVKVELKTEDGKGTELADYARIARILRDANYRGYVALEYEAKEDPMTAVPQHLAALAKAIA